MKYAYIISWVIFIISYTLFMTTRGSRMVAWLCASSLTMNLLLGELQ